MPGKHAASTDTLRRKAHVNPGRCTMPTPPPRHLATPRRPWRLLLFVFGSPPRSWPPWWPRPPCCPSPNRRAGHPASRSRRANTASPDIRIDHHHARREPTTAPPLPPLRTLGGAPSATDHDHPIGCGPSAGHGRRKDTNHGALDRWRHHPAHRDRATDHGRAHHPAPTSTVASTTTLVSTTSVAPTTGPTTSAAPTRPGQPRPGRPRRADHDRGGNDDDRTGDPAREPTGRRLGHDRQCAAAHPGLLYLLRGLVPSRWDTRQAAPASHPRRRR